MKKIDYITIPGYALWLFHLSGNELLCFSLIHSFSHSELGYFKGTLEEVSEVLNISKRSAAAAISKLEDRGLITKTLLWEDNKKVSALSSKVQNLQLAPEEDAKFASTKVQNLQHPPIICINDSNNDTLKEERKVQNLQHPKQPTAQAQPIPQVPLAPLPFKSAAFKEIWDILCSSKKWRCKTNHALNISLKKLSHLTEEEAIEAIENAIEGDWQGLWPDKYKKKQAPQQQSQGRVITDAADIEKLLRG